MTDDEFNVLDELYFVTSYVQLKSQLDFDDAELILILKKLQSSGWVKFLKTVDEEWEQSDLDDDQMLNSFYLATKTGLLAHNS